MPPSDYEKLLRVCEEFIEAMRAAGLMDVANDFEGRVRDVRPHDMSQEIAEDYMAWYNREFGRKFRVHVEVIRLVRALTARWYSLEDMQLVARYLASQWADDPKMARFVVPTSMLTFQKFQERLDLAKEWEAKRTGVPQRPPKYVPPTVKDPVKPQEVQGLVATVVAKLKRGQEDK